MKTIAIIAVAAGIAVVGAMIVFGVQNAEQQAQEQWMREAAKEYVEKVERENAEILAEKEREQEIEPPITSPPPEPEQPSYEPAPTSSRFESQKCDGYAECFTGDVTEIIDGDTIKVAGQSIRFALVDTPEFGENGYSQARNFIVNICPVGSTVLVDEDDMQTQGSYGRMIAVVYCNGMNLNKAVLDQGHAEIDTYFCSKSEFEYHSWAQRHGCAYQEPTKPETESTQTQHPSCDPSYPDFCIPSPPPDLDCKDIPQKRFTVLQPDPHRFDGDKDGIGCES